mgnify:CR=1 FL=1
MKAKVSYIDSLRSLGDVQVFENLTFTKNTIDFDIVYINQGVSGSRLLFLKDNTLLISSGDGFNYREKAQSLNNHFEYERILLQRKLVIGFR